MREVRSFAYSLSQADDGWRWRIYDEDGETVAGGAHPSQQAAMAEVETVLRGVGMEIDVAA